MLTIKEHMVVGYEKVIEGIDPDVKLHCFIAVHNTLLGPALGGTRIYPYASRDDALDDVLRLAKGMTYKSAIAECGLGGGKAVIIADPKEDKTEGLLLAYGAVVDYLQGLYIAAEDIGSSTDDIMIVKQRTPYVAALPIEKSSGDPSRFTAWGVFRGMQAVAKCLWDVSSLQGKRVAIQGVGSVGEKLVEHLFWEGVDLTICDICQIRAKRVADRYGAKLVDTADFVHVPCDILSPCALGGILNEQTIPQLQCQAVAGSANNQIFEESCGDLLMKRGILYAPDYVINAGGIINASGEFDPEAYNAGVSRDRVNNIYHVLFSIFEQARHKHLPSNLIDDRMAEYKLKHSIGKRTAPLTFHI